MLYEYSNGSSFRSHGQQFVSRISLKLLGIKMLSMHNYPSNRYTIKRKEKDWRQSTIRPQGPV